MSKERVERRLAAILAADVAGYSRLMGVDEEGTLSALPGRQAGNSRSQDGRVSGDVVVKTTGDGFLVEFASVVDATLCALDVQRRIRERNISVPQDKPSLEASC